MLEAETSCPELFFYNFIILTALTAVIIQKIMIINRQCQHLLSIYWMSTLYYVLDMLVSFHSCNNLWNQYYYYCLLVNRQAWPRQVIQFVPGHWIVSDRADSPPQVPSDQKPVRRLCLLPIMLCCITGLWVYTKAVQKQSSCKCLCFSCCTAGDFLDRPHTSHVH